MIKYVVKLNGKYLTRYGSFTPDVQCAEKFKEMDDALAAMSDITWGGKDTEPEIEEVEQ